MKTITLSAVIPEVFARAVPEGSQVWGTELELRRGQTMLVEAASGRGKSSLCGYLYGYRRDYQGIISFDGRDIRTLSRTEWSAVRRGQLAIMMQDLRLFPELTSLENVSLKNNLTHHFTQEEIEGLFERLGVADKLHECVARLSFGQQQRVAFVRTLCQKADFALLDEPISHLDDANAAAMADILRQWASAQGAAVVVTSIGRHFHAEWDKVIKL